MPQRCVQEKKTVERVGGVIDTGLQGSNAPNNCCDGTQQLLLQSVEFRGVPNSVQGRQFFLRKLTRCDIFSGQLIC